MAQNVCQYLGELIDIHLEKEKVSIRALAKACNVDYTTIYRLTEKQQKSLSFINAFKILRYITPSTYLAVLSDYFPVEVKTLELDTHKPIDFKIDIYKQLASDFSLYKVFCFASCLPGCTKEAIEKRFGQEGLELLQTLFDLKALEEREGIFVDLLEGMVFYENSDLKSISQFHQQMVSLNIPGSTITISRAGLSKEGIAASYAAHQDFQARNEKISRDYPGNIIAVSSAIFGPVDHGEENYDK